MERKPLTANSEEGVNNELAPLNYELSKGWKLTKLFGCCVRGIKEGVGGELEEKRVTIKVQVS